MRKRKSTRSINRNNLIPLILIGAGALLVFGVLVWQAISNSPANNANPVQQSNIPLPEIERVTLAESKAALDEGTAVFLDVRDPGSYEAGHIPGAINIPLATLENQLDQLNPNDWIITYCTWPAEESSARAASILESRGYTNVQPILGGFAAWQQAGYPVE